MRTRMLVVAIIVSAAAGGYLAGDAWRERSASPPQTTAWVYGQARDPGAFELVAHDGEPFTPASIAGRWTLWFFGFTHCPDICPITLTTLDLVDQALADGGHRRPGVVMVSVDPARDTPEVLADYMAWFNPGFTGVTGDAAEIHQLTRRLGIAVAYRAEGDDGSYTVDHGSSLLLSDPQGRVRAVFQPPHKPATIAHDLAVLIPWLEKST